MSTTGCNDLIANEFALTVFCSPRYVKKFRSRIKYYQTQPA